MSAAVPQFLDLQVYRTIVDCTISGDPVERFRKLRNAGNYDWTNDFVKDNHARHWAINQTARQERELVLVRLDRRASSDEALAYMRQNNLNRPTVADGLAFGVQHPEQQCRFPIAVLAEQRPVFDGRRRVLVLFSNRGNRVLGATRFDDWWPDYCDFLACK